VRGNIPPNERCQSYRSEQECAQCPNDKCDKQPVAGTAAFKIYPVADADASNVIFATSRNYSYNSVLTPTAGGVANNPFGDKGFVVQRKGGDASILRPNNATDNGNISQFEAQVGKKPGEAQGTASSGDPAGTLKQP